MQLPKPLIAPFSGGGVGLTWRLDDREITLNLFPGEHEVVYAQTGADEERLIEGSFSLGQADFVKELSDVFHIFLSTED
ncbi:MAG: hypothetical protein ACRD4Y_17195 [Candidatus Acidiferrales bacterium]